MAAGLDAAQGLSSVGSPRPPLAGGPRSGSPGSSGGIRGCEGAPAARAAAAGVRRSSTSRRSSRSSSRRSGRSTRSRARSSTSGRRQLPHALGRGRVPLDRAADDRDRRRRHARPTRCSPSRSRYFMARIASRGGRARSSSSRCCSRSGRATCIRVYAWRLILDHDGLLNWTLRKLGLPAANIAYTNSPVWLVFTYVWLPFMILPVYGGARADPGLVRRGVARPRRERTDDVPARHPAARAARRRRRLDLHVLAHARRLRHAAARRRRLVAVHRQRRLRHDRLEQRPVRSCVRSGAARRHGRLPPDRAQARRVRGPLMEQRATRIALAAWSALVVAVPVDSARAHRLYAFNKSNVQSWPIAGLHDQLVPCGVRTAEVRTRCGCRSGRR